MVLSEKCQSKGFICLHDVQIWKSGERTECVVAVDLNLIRWLVDLATELNGFRAR